MTHPLFPRIPNGGTPNLAHAIGQAMLIIARLALLVTSFFSRRRAKHASRHTPRSTAAGNNGRRPSGKSSRRSKQP